MFSNGYSKCFHNLLTNFLNVLRLDLYRYYTGKRRNYFVQSMVYKILTNQFLVCCCRYLVAWLFFLPAWPQPEHKPFRSQFRPYSKEA